MWQTLKALTRIEWVEIICTTAIIVILGALDLAVVIYQARRERRLWEEDKRRQDEQQTALDSIVEELVEMNDGGIKISKEQQDAQNPEPNRQ